MSATLLLWVSLTPPKLQFDPSHQRPEITPPSPARLPFPCSWLVSDVTVGDPEVIGPAPLAPTLTAPSLLSHLTCHVARRTPPLPASSRPLPSLRVAECHSVSRERQLLPTEKPCERCNADSQLSASHPRQMTPPPRTTKSPRGF